MRSPTLRLSFTAALAVAFAPALSFAQDAPLSARLISVRGTVQIVAPGAAVEHVGAAGEVLAAGARVLAGDDGVARVAMPNGATLTLLPGAQLALFASPEARPAEQPPSTATTLVTGTVRVSSAPVGAALLPLVAGPGTVNLGRGGGSVTVVRGAPFLRVAVHEGRLVARVGTASRALRAGMGLRDALTGARGAPAPLAAAPTWGAQPPARVTSLRGDGTLPLTFAAPGVRGLSGWRAELARDADFRDIVQSVRLPPRPARWDARYTTSGTWYARVMAIDAAGVEGTPSPTVHFDVETPEVLPGAEASEQGSARPASLRVPAGMFCGVDGARLAAAEVPLRLAPARVHRIRCANTPDGAAAEEFVVRARDAGPLRREVRLEQTGSSGRVLSLHLMDLDGNPLPYATVTVTSDADVVLDDMREGDQRGIYTASVRWRGQRATIPFQFTVNGEVSFTESVPTASPSPHESSR